MARRSALIKKIRQEGHHVLLLDAGDIFQGTPYFNEFGGEPEFRLMSEMGYDAATMGNHDFDNGLEGFDKMLEFADFPFICSNYNFDKTILAGKTVPYKIFNRGPLKIGVTGVGIELKGLVDSNNFGETVYLDPVETVNKYASLLKNEFKCDLVICLSHLGYSYQSKKISDLELASLSINTDLILGGHTHTFLPKPVYKKNRTGNKIMINQVGWAGLNLGRIDFEFRGKKIIESRANSAIEINQNCAKV